MSGLLSTKIDPQISGEHSVAAVDTAMAQGDQSGTPEQSTLRYDDGKAPEAFRTIGEVAKLLAIRPHVLRYWEDQFPMLRPVKRSGGRRYYRQEDVLLVEAIDRLVHREGYTLRGARQKLEDEARPGKRSTARLAPAVAASAKPKPDTTPKLASKPAVIAAEANDALIGRLSALRAELAKALDD